MAFGAAPHLCVRCPGHCAEHCASGSCPTRKGKGREPTPTHAVMRTPMNTTGDPGLLVDHDKPRAVHESTEFVRSLADSVMLKTGPVLRSGKQPMLWAAPGMLAAGRERQGAQSGVGCAFRQLRHSALSAACVPRSLWHVRKTGRHSKRGGGIVTKQPAALHQTVYGNYHHWNVSLRQRCRIRHSGLIAGRGVFAHWGTKYSRRCHAA